MVEWAATDEYVCGFGDDGTVGLPVIGWEPRGHPPALGSPVDAAVTGTTRGIRLPAVPRPADGAPLLNPVGPGTHRLVVGGPPETRVAFEAPASVDPDGEGVWLRFPSETAVVVGFREASGARETLSVPPTAEGLAAAVTEAGRRPETTDPRRSHPGFRPRTPAVTVDEGADPGRPTAGETNMVVPESALAVLVAAPLAYYLGATLRVSDGPPRIDGPGIDRRFDPLPAFAYEVADALRRLVALDSRLRSIPGEPSTLPEELAAGVPDRPPGGRLAAALEWSPDRVPTWPLSTYVDDDPTNGRYLPYLLDRLSLVHPAAASRLDPKALLERSLDEFFRGDAPNVEAVDPALSDSRHHAWLGDGTPVDAYTLVGDAAEDRSFGRDLTVEVVCNDAAMADERDVASVYRERLAAYDPEVRVHERLSTADLAAVLEGDADFVHFIGHCEVDGLVCPDGTLAAAALDGCGVGAAFLNACGSYYEGHELVRQGATAVAVTLTTVLDEQAVSLGTSFADLLASGFAVERALSLARGEIIVGRDYAVVGDGTYRLRPPGRTPGVFTVRPADDGRYAVRYDVTPPDGAGRQYLDPFEGCRRPFGEPSVATVDGDCLRDLLASTTLPVRYDGNLRWSDVLARELAESRQT